MDKKLLEILVCPLCKGKLLHDKKRSELICPVDRLAFPIQEGIPMMLVDDARKLPANEEVSA